MPKPLPVGWMRNELVDNFIAQLCVGVDMDGKIVVFLSLLRMSSNKNEYKLLAIKHI